MDSCCSPPSDRVAFTADRDGPPAAGPRIASLTPARHMLFWNPPGRHEVPKVGRLPARGASGAPWRAPVGLDHQPHREEEDEVRAAIRAAVVTPDSRGAGRDVTQAYDAAVAALRAPTVAGFW
jgi:hypothetical protein